MNILEVKEDLFTAADCQSFIAESVVSEQMHCCYQISPWCIANDEEPDYKTNGTGWYGPI